MDNKEALSQIRDIVRKANDKICECADNGHDHGDPESLCTICVTALWLALCDISKIVKEENRRV